MATFSVKVVDGREEPVTASSFKISKEGDLAFVNTGAGEDRTAYVFARGQWQFVKDES